MPEGPCRVGVRVCSEAAAWGDRGVGGPSRFWEPLWARGSLEDRAGFGGLGVFPEESAVRLWGRLPPGAGPLPHGPRRDRSPWDTAGTVTDTGQPWQPLQTSAEPGGLGATAPAAPAPGDRAGLGIRWHRSPSTGHRAQPGTAPITDRARTREGSRCFQAASLGTHTMSPGGGAAHCEPAEGTRRRRWARDEGSVSGMEDLCPG